MTLNWQEKPDIQNKSEDQLANYFKALGHPVRVRILRRLLAAEPCLCGELVDIFSLAQSTVSQHLKVLKDAGLVTSTADGPRCCYRVEAVALKQLRKYVSAL